MLSWISLLKHRLRDFYFDDFFNDRRIENSLRITDGTSIVKVFHILLEFLSSWRSVSFWCHQDEPNSLAEYVDFTSLLNIVNKQLEHYCNWSDSLSRSSSHHQTAINKRLRISQWPLMISNDCERLCEQFSCFALFLYSFGFKELSFLWWC